ncbi:hypothetical protein HFO74_07675 [Rhizobium laguerreae]|uniref:HEPN AbiU2-like domain-containing protein n=1 Tax=Rhizobium laguerreae TaxID=1076926 RepID=A0AB35F9Z4_9HYPH|nr:hypothetical protein [Rhizobium laguerreae]MBY3063319.1 hypothetical protein [Rhizobium laguerreae]MBY3075838.1 hypothetical protein [Rhizobium laguerreae]MBY3112087.1 hypothetical protein [Rhizobium laguerreae]MBY3201163.1 hypothetical protein [Rhizobium laguerreae]MBY3244391.1 hypothetical protein [Rhizobium laguerreae]
MAKKKKVLLSNADAIARLDMMIPILYRNIVNAIRTEATMEAGNALIPNLPNALPGALAFNAIMQSLAFDLAMHLARLYDVGNRNRHVNSRDVASIPLTIRLLRQKRCQRELRARARNWIPGSRSYADQFERDCANALERVSASYSETFKGQFGRGGLKTLKAFRDTFMAHSLMTDVDVKPIYNQLFRLTDCAKAFVENARIAVSGDNSSLDEQERIFLDQANDFWRMALLGERHGA